VKLRSGAAAGLALALLAGAPGAVQAHEVLHEVQRGRAVAVRVWFPDGEPLAYVQAEVFSPADAKVPHWKGRTDRNGWLAFVPDVAGRWRVRVVDATGHGLDTEVDVAGTGAAPGAPAEAADGRGEGAPPALPAAVFALRPVVGVALVAAIFGTLYLVRRRRRS
jgi:nickel transport protein